MGVNSDTVLGVSPLYFLFVFPKPDLYSLLGPTDVAFSSFLAGDLIHNFFPILF